MKLCFKRIMKEIFVGFIIMIILEKVFGVSRKKSTSISIAVASLLSLFSPDKEEYVDFSDFESIE